MSYIRFFLSLSSRPVGVFEIDKFAAGSKAVLEAIVAATTEKGATSIIGELEWVWLRPKGEGRQGDL